jgi:hypothetical protein
LNPMCSDPKYLVQPAIIRSHHGSFPLCAGPIRLLTIVDCQVGCPIRRSRDRRVLSPPPGLSQSATSFIASCCQGIHQTPFSRLIRSRSRRALLREAHVVLPRFALPEDVVQPNPLACLDGSLDPVARATGDGRSRHLGQCHRLGKTVFGVPPRFAPLEDGRPPVPPNAGRARSPLGPDPKTSRVSLSSRCQLTGCRHPGRVSQSAAAISRSDRKAHGP